MGRLRCLVTGGSGFVGRYILPALVEAGMDVAALSRAPARAADRWFAADLLDRDSLCAALREFRPDVIVHLAAQSSVALAQSGTAAATWRINVDGTANLGSAVAQICPGASVLFVSSGEVYGASFGTDPVTESTDIRPLSAYARSKAQAEWIIADTLSANNQLFTLRPFNHSGAGQSETFVLPSFAAQIAQCEAGIKDEIRVGNLDVGRDFLDVRDVVQAYLCLIRRREDLPNSLILNIASGQARNLRDLLHEMIGLAGRPFPVTMDLEKLRPNDVPIAMGSARLLARLTSWTPRYSVSDMLMALLDAARQKSRVAEPVERVVC